MPYKLTSAEDRARLIRASREGRDFIRLAENLGIKKTTAYNIVRSGNPDVVRRGGPRHIKVDQEIKNFLEECLSENPLLTLNEMNKKLRERYPEKPQISLSTIKNTLDGMFYTLKKAYDAPAERNTPIIREERRDYVTWLMRDGMGENLIFIDEMGANMWTRRSYGRNLRGRAYACLQSDGRSKRMKPDSMHGDQ